MAGWRNGEKSIKGARLPYRGPADLGYMYDA